MKGLSFVLYYHHRIKMTQQIQNHNVLTPKHLSLATGWQGCSMLGFYRIAKRGSGSGLKEAFGR